jgi:hypothetical protein
VLEPTGISSTIATKREFGNFRRNIYTVEAVAFFSFFGSLVHCLIPRICLEIIHYYTLLTPTKGPCLWYILIVFGLLS